MTSKSEHVTSILVAIVSHGTVNDRYLAELVREYRSMPFHVDIVVFSNVHKDVGPGVELIVVDLNGKNPGSLPFPHKQLFASRLDQYDLFIYSEDDTRLTERNLQAFLDVSSTLPPDEIPGFIRFEEGPDGSQNFPDVRGHFHWDPESVRCRNGEVFAYLTNEHSACYVLTREQLRGAIYSGGFLVDPHHAKYDRVCTAATDPYTQCGFQKLICISRLSDFQIHHLSNKYVGTGFGVSGVELGRQVDVLLRIAKNGHRPSSLFKTETKMMNGYYSKSYYESARPEILAAIPSSVQSVLSIGCGWGATEIALAEKGLRIVAVPLDPVIAGGAETKGVKIVGGDFTAARKALHGESFDCLLILNVLHLIAQPAETLSLFAQLLRSGATAIVQVPRVTRHTTLVRILRGNQRFKDVGNYKRTGVQVTSRRVIQRWVVNSGLNLGSAMNLVSPGAVGVPKSLQWLLNPARAEEEIVVVAHKS
jgi:2-polyprenyl-3-methyl-5-hydroxy-6-metoxy-1,4-benzoquinol methylase